MPAARSIGQAWFFLMPDYRHAPLTDELFFEPPKLRQTEKRRPLIRLACPSCGGIVSVNALDRAGQTYNVCIRCAGQIVVETDDTGAVSGIDGQPGDAKEERKGKTDLEPRSFLFGVVLTLIGLGVFYWLTRSLGAQ
jgi:hypothetical protein